MRNFLSRWTLGTLAITGYALGWAYLAHVPTAPGAWPDEWARLVAVGAPGMLGDEAWKTWAALGFDALALGAVFGWVLTVLVQEDNA